MGVADRLASALDRNDERPNVELAEALAAKPDRKAIAQLAGLLAAGTTAQQNDAVKVLSELGARKPELVAPHVSVLVALLQSKNNRNVWGAMSALATVASTEPKAVGAALDDILVAADKGSVIAKDKAMAILSTLAQAGNRRALPALLHHLVDAAPNQFPMYCELALPAVGKTEAARFGEILETRLKRIEQPAKRARVEKVLRKLRNL